VRRRHFFKSAIMVFIMVFTIGVVLPNFVTSQVQDKTLIAVPKEAMVLYAKIVAKLPSNTLQWIHDKAKDIAQRPGAENSLDKDTQAAMNQLMDSNSIQAPRDIMQVLFAVFKESIEQTNSDKTYVLARISEMNQISQSLGDYLKTLGDAALSANGCRKKDADSLSEEARSKTRAGIKDAQALMGRLSVQATMPPWPGSKTGDERNLSSRIPYIIHEPKTLGELKAAIRTVSFDLKIKQTTLMELIKKTSERVQIVDGHSKKLFQMMMGIMKKI